MTQRITTVCLVRHGETDWNRELRLQGREDLSLNSVGREQARLIAEYLASGNWDVLVSSPLMRAAQTAAIVGGYLRIDDIAIMNDFIERDYGAAAGLTLQER